ncbi:MAG: alpha/beta hydrolase, partial [Defluviitaleaceae bacterium]|nr:alpha/beta hydrolase [Defluviitaleaceae bacterium]
MKTYEDIVIAEIDGDKVLLDLVLPESDKPAPVILNIHGGGWVGGDHKGHRFCGDYIKRGWALADIGYRLSASAPFPAQIEDCHTAVRFLRANAAKYNLDPSRIGVFGFSAGGHLAALLGATADVKNFQSTGGWDGYASAVQAVVVANGP